jgi:outer membrane protein with beta-barrel domain
MRCCAEASGRFLAAFLATSILLTQPRAANAAAESRWAWGAQFSMVSTMSPQYESPISYGIQGGIMRRIVPIAWVGLDGGFYDHALATFYTANDAHPYPLQGPVYSSRLALGIQVGPVWAYRPYVTGGWALERLTDQRPYGGFHEHTWAFEVGAGMRGGDHLLPWFEWRWHRGLDRMSILGGAPLDYHTWGIGLGWN